MSYRHVQPLIRKAGAFITSDLQQTKARGRSDLSVAGSHLCLCWCSSSVSRMFTQTSARYRSSEFSPSAVSPR